MDFMEIQLDQEAINLAYMQINYYFNIPKFIKGRVCELNGLKPVVLVNDGILNPAYVVGGAITVVSGKLNMPVLDHSRQFLRNTTCHSATHLFSSSL